MTREARRAWPSSTSIRFRRGASPGEVLEFIANGADSTASRSARSRSSAAARRWRCPTRRPRRWSRHSTAPLFATGPSGFASPARPTSPTPTTSPTSRELLDLEARAEQEEARRRAQAEDGSAVGDGTTLTRLGTARRGVRARRPAAAHLRPQEPYRAAAADPASARVAGRA